LGAAEGRFGLPAVIFQGIAYLLAGYYASGAVFDFFKLGSLAVAAVSFNVNAPAFLEAVEDIAGAKSGLATLDKAVAAANSVKVFQALSKISSLLKESGGGSGTDMLADLGAYLTLDRAQKNLGFDAKAFGLSAAQAAEVAVVFGKYDLSKSTYLRYT
jgi:hypothetical protein